MIDPAEYHALGESLTTALLTGDFDLYCQVMTLPLRVNLVSERSYVLETQTALREDFELYVKANAVHHVTDIFRQVREIRTTAPREVAVEARVEILSHAGRVMDPFDLVHHLRRLPVGWRIFQIDSTPGHINWTLRRYEIPDVIARARAAAAKRPDEDPEA